MKNFKVTILALLAITYFFSVQAKAETAQQTQADKENYKNFRNEILRRRRLLASRRPASSDLRATADVPSAKEKNWDLSFDVLGGYASATSSDANTQALRDSSHFNRNGYWGLSTDLHFLKYGGFEAEGFYSTGRAGSDGSKVNLSQGTVSNISRSLNQYGGMGAIKAQYPVRFGRGWISPKAGLGYGILGLKENDSDSISGNTSTSNLQVRGPYATIGFDAEVLPSVIVMADGAMSFGAKGSVASTSGSQDLGSVDTASASYLRLRGGAYYKFTQNFLAGAQYNRRELKYTVSGAENKEAFDQFLGVVGVTF